MAPTSTTERLTQLRELMKQNSVDIYIVPSEDSHQSEYIASCDARRQFITGFTGSAGTAIITTEKAILSTDGRYFNQAGKELDGNWELLKQGMQDVPTWEEWVATQSEGGKAVGVDPRLITAPGARKLAEQIKKKGGGELKPVKMNLVDHLWTDKPAPPNEKLRALGLEFTGKKFQDKIEDLRRELDKKKSAGIVISMLDEIAWLFNVRGGDIPFNPVFFSYAVVTPTASTLYVDDKKLSPEVKLHLGDSVDIRPYDSIIGDLEALAKSNVASAGSDGTTSSKPQKFLISTKASWALSESLGGEEKVDEIRSPVGDAKAIKNDTELNGMKQCHIRDGAALTEYFAWLEDHLVNKKANIDEVGAADKLEEIRSRGQYFAGLSFPSISSTGANAAIIHYKPEKGECSVVDPNAIYLCDSGAQYLDGTTDTTRTLHFGEPTEMEIKAYTLVLKGMIALELMKFPKGVSGFAIDMSARQFLWAEGLDYRHGTGHGIGSFLNVHEGPIGIGTRVQYSEVALSPGNVISNEPGYYEDGSFGIRIENVIVCREVKLSHAYGDKPYLGFEHVTLVPLCRKLIDTKMLTDGEIKYLNDYHQEVWDKTHGLFEGGREDDKVALAWLKRETQPYYAVRAAIAGL